VGDLVLKGMANTLTRAVRQNDGVFRVGGDEFSVIPTGAAPEIAVEVTERLSVGIKNQLIDVEEGCITVTVSVGIAHLRHGESATAFYRRADRAMYAARKSERNRLCVSN
jgi:diguanylate cyclase (GGDEF)-like protein